MTRLAKHALGFLAIGMMVVASAGPAAAQEDSSGWSARPIGEFAARWRGNWTPWYEQWHERRERKGDSDFEFDRAVLGLAASDGERFDARISVIAESETATEFTGERLPAEERDRDEVIFRPVAAWARVTWVPSVQTEAGIVPTGWIDFANVAYRRRYVEKTAYELWLYRRAPLRKGFVATEDRAEIRAVSVPERRPSESDVGVAVGGAAPHGYLRYRLGIYAGEGLLEPENAKGNAADLRVTIAPFARVEKLDGMTVSGYAWGEEIDADAGETLMRVSAMAHYRGERADGRRIDIAFEAHNQFYSPQDDGTEHDRIHASVFSMWCDIDVARRTAFIGRYDHFDPDRRNGLSGSGYRDERSMFLLGAAYDFDDTLSVAFDMRFVSHRAEIFNDVGETRIPKPEALPYAQIGYAF
ncbi:MAG: hypothetical protein IT350_16335 [Deltaproteobacteria bacterium]|nr:hypothetical protein [Deltaproteobacteria bacterium]